MIVRGAARLNSRERCGVWSPSTHQQAGPAEDERAGATDIINTPLAYMRENPKPPLVHDLAGTLSAGNNQDVEFRMFRYQ